MARVTRGISLEEWEEKTKLTEKEKQSVYDLQDACTELPLPSNWVRTSHTKLALLYCGLITSDCSTLAINY